MQMSRSKAMGARGCGLGGRKGGTWRLRRTEREVAWVVRSLAVGVSSRIRRRMERERIP